jgi:hypothetical protein
MSNVLSLSSSPHLSNPADILAFKRKQSTGLVHDAAVNKIILQEEKFLHYKEVRRARRRAKTTDAVALPT